MINKLIHEYYIIVAATNDACGKINTGNINLS